MVHFFNYKQSLYDSTLRVELLERLRNEEKFDSVEALTMQLHADKEHALQIIKSYAE